MVKALVLGTEAAVLGKIIFFSRTRWDLNAAYEGPPQEAASVLAEAFSFLEVISRKAPLHAETAATCLVTQKQKCFQKRLSVCILLQTSSLLLEGPQLLAQQGKPLIDIPWQTPYCPALDQKIQLNCPEGSIVSLKINDILPSTFAYIDLSKFLIYFIWEVFGPHPYVLSVCFCLLAGLGVEGGGEPSLIPWIDSGSAICKASTSF